MLDFSMKNTYICDYPTRLHSTAANSVAAIRKNNPLNFSPGIFYCQDNSLSALSATAAT